MRHLYNRFKGAREAIGICLIAAASVHIIGHKPAEAAYSEGDSTEVAAGPTGTYDHGIEKLEGFELINVLPSRKPFAEGENFVYSIQYGLITAGEATLEIRNLAMLDSTLTYHIVSIARTNKVFDKVFKVRDRHESFMDYDDLYSHRFVKHLREGKYRKDRQVDFDQKNHLAVYADRTIPIAPNTHDFLTALYYIRTIDVEPGQAVAMANHTDHKNYPIYIKFLRREKVKVPAGEFECIVVEPVLETSAIFENKGKLTIWMTDDNLRMPVMMRSKVIVGAFESVLKEYTLGSEEPAGMEKRGGETDGG